MVLCSQPITLMLPEYAIKGRSTYRLITDHLESWKLLVNTATGSVSGRADYNEWGNITSGFDSLVVPFGYAGGLYDPTTKLVRFGARDYDASTGRWLAKDPTGFKGGDANLYKYAKSDPIDITDPNGRFTFGETALAFTITGAAINVGATAVSDFITGDEPKFEKYFGSAISGALFGFGMWAGANPIALGSLSNTIGEAFSQVLSEEGIQKDKLTEAFFTGALTGWCFGGNTSYTKITKGLLTKLSQGTISNVAGSTMNNMLYESVLRYGVIESAFLTSMILSAFDSM
jgi:RHS repeat-associated protein